MCIFFICYLYAKDHSGKEATLTAFYARQVPEVFYFTSIFLVIHFSAYGIWSLKLISDYKKAAYTRISRDQKNNINWLSSTLIFFIAFLLAGMLNNFLEFISFARYYFPILTVFIITLFVFVNYLVFRALRSPLIFYYIEESELAVAKKQPQSLTFLNSAEMKIKAEQLRDFMTVHKPYLDPDIIWPRCFLVRQKKLPE